MSERVTFVEIIISKSQSLPKRTLTIVTFKKQLTMLLFLLSSDDLKIATETVVNLNNISTYL